MISCSYDCDNDKIIVFDGINDKNIVINNCYSNVESYNDIKMLNLGECEGVITPLLLFTKSNCFSQSNEFSESSEFSKTRYFSSTEDFTTSLSFTETKYTISEFDNSISFRYSFVLSYKYMKSVSFSLDYYMFNTYSIDMDDNGETKIVSFESYISKYNPYIIHYLTQTYVRTKVPFETLLKRPKLSQQNLIGIVCGSVAVFFIILGIIIFVRKKKYEEKSFYDDIDSSSSEITEVKEYQVNFDNETIKKFKIQMLIIGFKSFL